MSVFFFAQFLQTKRHFVLPLNALRTHISMDTIQIPHTHIVHRCQRLSLFIYGHSEHVHFQFSRLFSVHKKFICLFHFSFFYLEKILLILLIKSLFVTFIFVQSIFNTEILLKKPHFCMF